MIKPSMKGASGLTSTLRPVAEATYEYEVCFKCHTHTAPFALPLVNRVASNADVSEQFSPGNASFHPVETQGRNMDVPSLVSPLNVASLIYCTDCHGSDDSRVKGPHGSAYRPMLVRDYEVTDGTSESPQTFALCYGCHNRASILGDQSFPLHRKHVVEEHAPCAICHDAHGISATQASPPNGTHLINFDRDVVLPVGGAAMPVFQDKGRFKGSCTLRCHGEVHDGKEYP
jgi:hypothetical protein